MPHGELRHNHGQRRHRLVPPVHGRRVLELRRRRDNGHLHQLRTGPVLEHSWRRELRCLPCWYLCCKLGALCVHAMCLGDVFGDICEPRLHNMRDLQRRRLRGGRGDDVHELSRRSILVAARRCEVHELQPGQVQRRHWRHVGAVHRLRRGLVLDGFGSYGCFNLRRLPAGTIPVPTVIPVSVQ